MKLRRCPRGHRIEGGNVAWYVSHGRRRRRCRMCRADYMRTYMRGCRRKVRRRTKGRRAQ